MMKKSLIYKQYISYLKNSQIKYVSFDIFDTLLFRNLVKPTHLFENMAEQNKDKFTIFHEPKIFKEFRMSAEEKARKNSTYEEITLEEIYSNLPINKKVQKQLIQLELNCEKKILNTNYMIIKFIKLAKKYNKKIILLSDTYFNIDQISYFLPDEIKKQIDLIFLSSETKLTKFHGTLYKYLLDNLSINSNEIIHIGDNYKSDIEMANKHNIRTLLFNVPKKFRKSIELDNQYIKNKDFFNFHNFRIQASLLNPYEESKKEFFFHLGSSLLGPIVWEFCNYLLSYYKKLNYNQINFCMREGQIFNKFIKKIDPNINSNLIYISRKASYLASLNIKEIKNNEFRLENYEDFNVRDLYKLFKIDPLDTKVINNFEYKFYKKNCFKKRLH